MKSVCNKHRGKTQANAKPVADGESEIVRMVRLAEKATGRVFMTFSEFNSMHDVYSTEKNEY